MKKLTCVLCLVVAGCSWKSTVDSVKFDGLTYDKGAIKGAVTGEGFAHYGGCENAVKKAINDAVEKSKAMGGDSIGEIKWLSEAGETDTPVCKGTFYLYYWYSKAMLSAKAILKGKQND